jgi:hypothetical protein
MKTLKVEAVYLMDYAGADQEEQAGGAQIDAQAADEIWLCPRQARHR